MAERRAREWLRIDVDRLLQEYIAGKTDFEEGIYLTPSTVADMLVITEGLESTDRPSTGAVDAIFRKMQKIGYAVFSKDPFRFEAFTAQGEALGFDELVKIYKKSGGRLTQEYNTRGPLKPRRNKAEELKQLVDPDRYVPRLDDIL